VVVADSAMRFILCECCCSIDRLKRRIARQHKFGALLDDHAIARCKAAALVACDQPTMAMADDVELAGLWSKPERPCPTGLKAHRTGRLRLHQRQNVRKRIDRRILDYHDRISDFG